MYVFCNGVKVHYVGFRGDLLAEIEDSIHKRVLISVKLPVTRKFRMSLLYAYSAWVHFHRATALYRYSGLDRQTSRECLSNEI